jgi:hypothetical protein
MWLGEVRIYNIKEDILTCLSVDNNALLSTVTVRDVWQDMVLWLLSNEETWF